MKSEDILIAHIDVEGNIQEVKAHLLGTARRAKEFATEFGCGDAAYLCGLLHDIGKYSEAFQKRIRNPLSSNRVDHSTAGAVEIQKLDRNYIALGMAVAGHHSGLLDGGNITTANPEDGTYFGRHKKTLEDYSRWKMDLQQEISDIRSVAFPTFCNKSSFNMSFFIRMIFSCLVDADYLDTEAFMNGTQAERGGYDSPETLRHCFEEYVSCWLETEGSGAGANTELCRQRNRILRECMEKGKEYSRGLYTLTVPTGGGKTTASMGFALNHICTHGLKRIIYVIPYTSVIDQNAAVFEHIFGQENVLEHHSGVWYDVSEDEGEEKNYRKALAAENWDAPIVVTTAVQFFESLYGSRSGKCRKLHNIANSVIIFDEAQTLPVPYLEPCVAAMAQLAENYRSTVVLCTATQPALEERFQTYIPECRIREICSGTEELFAFFKRNVIKNINSLSAEELEERLCSREQVLCIVNRRKTAQELYQALEEDGVFCLTTLLCPADRKLKFAEIRERLHAGEKCRVIATSLLEAGVDLDFPQVYRQEAGLDSLIQAAGRCNREGKRPREEQIVYSFRLEGEESRYAAQSIAALREAWRRYEAIDEPEAISFYFQYFRDLLGKENLDQKEIMAAWGKGIGGSCFPFATVSQKFHLIENAMKTVYIPLEEAFDLLKEAETGAADRNTYRKLGQYGVNVYENHFAELWRAGCLEEISKEIFVLRDRNQYSRDTGLKMDVETGYGILI
ncbi:MAG: CRISPR-associated helicase Cas3' [Butyrivibrio sp.]|nr:CRISPR-associated helicase Cas3' [Butyrivibrio sp.]